MNFDDEFGRQYEQTAQRTILGYELIFQMANSFLANTLPETAHILVVGAGGGKELVAFSANHPGWSFVGVDPAGQMVAFAQHKVQQAGVTNRVHLIQGVAQDAPTDQPFDAATCILVFPFIHGDEAKLATLRTIADRLKPGAPLVIVIVDEENNREDFRLIWRDYQLANGSTREQFAGTRESVRAAVQPFSVMRLMELLDEAGFENSVPFFRALWFAGWFIWKKVE